MIVTDAEITYECSVCGRKPLSPHFQDERIAIACAWCELVYCGDCMHITAGAECRARQGGRQTA